MSWVVAIDGPGGSGKSTVSRELARRLGVAHLDTGAFYRAATHVVLAAGVDPSDAVAVLAAVEAAEFDQIDGRTFVDGHDVEEEIRGQAVTSAVSEVSAYPEVRIHMVRAQRQWVDANGGSAVVEGRDIGTVVFPDAILKVFLEADPVERARRRALESGMATETVQRDLERRDAHDSTRSASPLTMAEDAAPIDTTSLGVDEVVEAILGLLED
ncbi:MAG: (d)CMP kinase [Acidimicrobiia bacterium]|nr:(d)CMP kinase [Acidimicrobiia bacterium]